MLVTPLLFCFPILLNEYSPIVSKPSANVKLLILAPLKALFPIFLTDEEKITSPKYL